MMNDFVKSQDIEVNYNRSTLFDSEPGTINYKNKMAVHRLQEALAEFGLSSNQSKVFIFLGKLGPKMASEVSKETRIPRTETYHLINTLQNRGIVTAEFCSPARYSALPIDQALTTLINAEREKLNSLSKQKRTIMELWDDIPSLSVEEASSEPKEKLQVLQGSNSINSKIADFVRSSQTEFLMIGTEQDIARFYHEDFFEMLDTTKLKARFIVSNTEKIPKFIKGKDRTLVRTLKNIDNGNNCFIIKDSGEVLLFTKNAGYPASEVTAVWSDSKTLISTLRLLFDCCWEKSNFFH